MPLEIYKMSDLRDQEPWISMFSIRLEVTMLCDNSLTQKGLFTIKLFYKEAVRS